MPALTHILSLPACLLAGILILARPMKKSWAFRHQTENHLLRYNKGVCNMCQQLLQYFISISRLMTVMGVNFHRLQALSESDYDLHMKRQQENIDCICNMVTIIVITLLPFTDRTFLSISSEQLIT
jgi:hypothetical protein